MRCAAHQIRKVRRHLSWTPSCPLCFPSISVVIPCADRYVVAIAMRDWIGAFTTSSVPPPCDGGDDGEPSFVLSLSLSIHGSMDTVSLHSCCLCRDRMEQSCYGGRGRGLMQHNADIGMEAITRTFFSVWYEKEWSEDAVRCRSVVKSNLSLQFLKRLFQGKRDVTSYMPKNVERIACKFRKISSLFIKLKPKEPLEP